MNIDRKEFLKSPARWQNRLYKIWDGMISRCHNKNSSNYIRYGGRGIKVCTEWKKDFWKFYDWAINNNYKSEYSLDRIDNNKGYSPNNCRWATKKQQANNTSGCRYITINGITHTLMEWSEISGINYDTLRKKLNSRPWIAEELLGKYI